MHGWGMASHGSCNRMDLPDGPACCAWRALEAVVAAPGTPSVADMSGYRPVEEQLKLSAYAIPPAQHQGACPERSIVWLT